jgi:hypothetical protein
MILNTGTVPTMDFQRGAYVRVVVEFFGVPRGLAKVAQATVEVDEGADLRALLRSVRDRFPALSASVIGARDPELLEPYMLNIDGRTAPDDLGYRLREGERVLIMSSLVGG